MRQQFTDYSSAFTSSKWKLILLPIRPHFQTSWQATCQV